MNWSQRYYKKSQISIDTFSLLLSLMTAIYIKNGAFVFPKTFLDFAFLIRSSPVCIQGLMVH